MASPIETPTWEREVQCGCKGCGVARNNEKKRIINLLKILISENSSCFTLASGILLNDFIKDLSGE